MTIITIYALFGDDIRLVFFDKRSDNIFNAITCFSMFFFALELIIASLAKEDYFFGFYFWLDLVATVSLLFDVGWIWEPLTGTQDFSAGNAEQATSLARAGRGARVGTKAGRIVRFVRMIRLIRIVKLYKHAHTAITDESGPSSLLMKRGTLDPKQSKKGQVTP